LFHRKLFPELVQLTGDRSVHPLLDKHKRKTALLDWPEELSFLDINVRADYERLKTLA